MEDSARVFNSKRVFGSEDVDDSEDVELSELVRVACGLWPALQVAREPFSRLVVFNPKYMGSPYMMIEVAAGAVEHLLNNFAL